MSNETKRDVFETIADKCAGYNDELYERYLKQYDAALPDNLPVIPNYVSDWIQKCKNDGISIGDMLCSERRPEKMRDWMALTPGTYEFNQKRYKEYQDLGARAWLDGYTVED